MNEVRLFTCINGSEDLFLLCPYLLRKERIVQIEENLKLCLAGLVSVCGWNVS